MSPWRGAAATVEVCDGPELATCTFVAEGIGLGADAADATTKVCGSPELATCVFVTEGIGFAIVEETISCIPWSMGACCEASGALGYVEVSDAVSEDSIDVSVGGSNAVEAEVGFSTVSVTMELAVL
jgi:hypothetical protein